VFLELKPKKLCKLVISVAVLTISDKGSKGEREDLSGPQIAEILKPIGVDVKHYEIVPDEKTLIKDKLTQYCGKVDLILTTGGTGLAPRDVTPDATLEVIDKEVSGIVEAMRSEGFKKTHRSILSRAVAGIKGKTLIINLPGSPKAVRENLEVILDVIPHAIEKIKGDTTECARP
jgi:molybdopterin adenylyltransferase